MPTVEDVADLEQPHRGRAAALVEAGALDQVGHQRAAHHRVALRERVGERQRLRSRAAGSGSARPRPALEGEVDRLGVAAGRQVVAHALAQDLLAASAGRRARTPAGPRGWRRSRGSAGPPRRGPAGRPRAAAPAAARSRSSARRGRSRSQTPLARLGSSAKPRPVEPALDLGGPDLDAGEGVRAGRAPAGPRERSLEPSGAASIAPARTVPPAISAISGGRRGSPLRRQASGSAPRSKRWLASVCMPRRCAPVRRTGCGRSGRSRSGCRSSRP